MIGMCGKVHGVLCVCVRWGRLCDQVLIASGYNNLFSSRASAVHMHVVRGIRRGIVVIGVNARVNTGVKGGRVCVWIQEDDRVNP